MTYVGPDGGVEGGVDVCAKAGCGAYKIEIKRIKIKKRLYIFELYFIANLVVVVSAWMDFQSITRGVGREVGRPPRFGDYLIYHDHFGVNPKYGYVKRHKQHVNGRIDARISSNNKKQAFVTRQNGTEHESAQTAKERITKFDAGRIVKMFVLILYKNIG